MDFSNDKDKTGSQVGVYACIFDLNKKRKLDREATMTKSVGNDQGMGMHVQNLQELPSAQSYEICLNCG